jgi:hypothetical protein
LTAVSCDALDIHKILQTNAALILNAGLFVSHGSSDESQDRSGKERVFSEIAEACEIQ